nr:hypothetical protein [Tanacetum cinerariifolium]
HRRDPDRPLPTVVTVGAGCDVRGDPVGVQGHAAVVRRQRAVDQQRYAACWRLDRDASDGGHCAGRSAGNLLLHPHHNVGGLRTDSGGCFRLLVGCVAGVWSKPVSTTQWHGHAGGVGPDVR